MTEGILIQKCRKCCSYFWTDEREPIYCPYCGKRLEGEEQTIVEVNWISITDKLPTYEFHVMGRLAVNILLTDGEMVMVGDYTDGVFNTLGVPNKNITHWMPLPKPPNKKIER